MSGPCSRAQVISGGVFVPTSGTPQSAYILGLIAAAPEMYELLTKFVSGVPALPSRPCDCRKCDMCVRWDARALLAKIDGA